MILPVVCLLKILDKLIILRARINKTTGVEEVEAAKEMQEADEVEQADIVVVEQAGAEIERRRRRPYWGKNVRRRSRRIFRLVPSQPHVPGSMCPTSSRQVAHPVARFSPPQEVQVPKLDFGTSTALEYLELFLTHQIKTETPD